MTSQSESLEPGLHLVATPLGNMGDISLRARETISRASFVAGESSQSLKRLLSQIPALGSRKLISYRESSRDQDTKRILRLLEEGESVVLVSDAGTPTISDPGWRLVQTVRATENPVFSVPGPCAAILALTLSGFSCRRFVFEGFLPVQGKARREALERIAEQEFPVVLYESPHRILQTIRDLAQLEDQRQVCICRELTKMFEESWRGTLAEAQQVWPEKTIKGEFTLVLGESSSQDSSPDLDPHSLEFVRSLGLPSKQGTKILKHFFPQASKKEIYRLLSQAE